MQKETAAQESVKSAMDILEQHFKANTYLVTHYITLADVITWCNLVVPYKQVCVKFRPKGIELPETCFAMSVYWLIALLGYSCTALALGRQVVLDCQP